MTTLITFLGLGPKDPKTGENRYETVRYYLPDEPDRQVETSYVAQAISELEKVGTVHVLATQTAWDTHGEKLRQRLNAGMELRAHIIPDGKDEQQLREQFRILRETLQQAREAQTLLFDITHGFRTQPFFAAAVLAVMQAAGDLPEDTRILYGAFEAAPKPEDGALKQVPIWELTTFLNMQQTAFGIATFLQTGHAENLLQALKKEARQLRRRAINKQRQSFPASNSLIKALERFSQDLSTLRLPHLMRGVNKEEASAERLVKAIANYQEEACNKDHPALVPLLDDLKEMAEKLIIEAFASEERPAAMQHLMALYLRFHRYLEAAAVAREEIVNLMATGDAIEPATANFDNDARHAAERQTTAESDIRGRLDVRNDLLHCAMRKNPMPADKIMKHTKNLVELTGAMGLRHPRTIFVTRHAGAREWARRQGLVVDEVVEHLEPEEVHAGDLVIGTLPVHLVAEINRRGARYKHLTLDIPPEHRGRELSADDMEKFGARLQEYCVVSPDESKRSR